MKKIISVILVITGILFAALSLKAVFSIPQTDSQIRNAITVTDGKVLSENEGKLVVVSGTLTADEPLADPLTGVKLPGVTAIRTVWTYECVGEKNDEKVWDWRSEATDYSEKANYGINAEILTSTMLAAPTSLGEFKVESKLLAPIMRTADFKDYDEASLKDGWNLFTGFMKSQKCISKAYHLPEKTTGRLAAWGEGTQKVTYSTVAPDDPLAYTIIGIQKGDTITKAEDIDTVTTLKGIMTADEFADKSKKGARGGSIFGIVAGILLAVIGVGMMIFRRQ